MAQNTSLRPLQKECVALLPSCEQPVNLATKLENCQNIAVNTSQSPSDFAKCTCPVYGELATCAISKDAKCEELLPEFYSKVIGPGPECIKLGLAVLPKSTAGGNSTTGYTAKGNSTSSASHASAVAAMLFAIILN